MDGLGVSNEIQDPEIVLKTTPPRLSKALVLRARLSSDGPEFRDKSVIEVCAPPGFGKTSLLAQWRRESLNCGQLVAWLTLDRRDDNFRLAEGLAYAMRLASGRPVFDRITALSSRRMRGGLESFTAWLAEIANLGADTLMILDEVQLAPEQTIRQALSYLLLNAPPNLRLVLASRRHLELPLADLQARGMCADVSAERLRFTQQETTTLLSAKFGCRITADDCVRLHEKCAGWPLGLRLAIAAIEKSPSLDVSIRELNASSDNFDRYFLDNLLAGVNPDVIDFLVKISILDALCADLCRVVSGTENAFELLESLHDSLPIFTLSADGEWMRLHPMVREFLQNRVRLWSPAAISELHERAAKWLADRDLHEEAATHALAAGRKELAYALMGDCLRSTMLRGHQVRVLHWLDQLPPTELERHPRALLGAAWALAESERHEEAAHLVKKVLEDPSASPDDRFESALISGAAAYFADRIDEGQKIIGPWLNKTPPESIELRRAMANTVATLYLYQGKLEQVRHSIRSAYEAWPPGVDAICGWGEWLIGFSYIWEGQVQLAAEALGESLSRFDRTLGRRTSLSVLLASALATALWECGRKDEAADVMLDRLDILERVSSPESIAMGYQIAARSAMASGNERRALDLLENLFAIGEMRRIPRFCVTSLSEQVRTHALSGRADSAGSAYRRLVAIIEPWGNAPEGLLYPLLKLRASITGAFAALSKRDWDGMLSMLGPCPEQADRLRRGREVIEVKLLTALALRRLGEDANSLVTEATSLANLYGLKATLIHSHPEMFDWSNHDLANKSVVAHSRQSATGPTRKPGLLHTTGLLTVKEEEVLGLLRKNFSNKQIASALNVGDETIKWHLKNLFGKLNAGSRKHAVDRARMLGILSD